MSESVSNKAYIKVILKLLQIFKEKYSEGGWLPPARKMAEELGVAYRTYWKAINCLAEESFVTSYHGKGYYVIPNNRRIRKIGFVIRDGLASPFYEQCDSMIECMQYIRDNKFTIHLIQGTHPRQIYENAVAHGVEGLLWFRPSTISVPFIQEINQNKNLPLVTTHWGYADQNYQGCCISYDIYKVGCKKAQFLIQKGHRNIFIPEEEFSKVNLGILETLKKNDKKIKYNIYSDPFTNPEGFLNLYKKEKPTAIICEGGAKNFNAIVNILKPVIKESLTVILHTSEEDVEKIEKAPFIKLYVHQDVTRLHKIAAEKLLNYINKGEPLKEIKVSDLFLIDYSRTTSGEKQEPFQIA